MSLLDKSHQDPVFDALPVPTVLLDDGLVIRAVNRAYAAAVGRTAEQLLSLRIDEAFPDNPGDAAADGVANLLRSAEIVLTQRRPHHMLVQRYDVRDLRTGEWVRRVWSPVNSPVVAQGRVVGVVHQARDITGLGDEVRAVLTEYRDLLAHLPADDPAALRLAERAEAVATTLGDHDALAAEVADLRRALTSRATIEQAKGLIMAERRCTADEAFGILVKLSSDTNVRLADVARALVYRAQGERAAEARPIADVDGDEPADVG